MYIHTFKFIQSRNLTDSQKFFIKYPNHEQIPTTADKLKYFRYKKSLLQREVAEYAGIDRSTYINYESNNLDYYPIEKLIKIAELFEIDVKLLLDDYNYFLYKGQGNQIRRLRKELNLTQNEFGQLYGATAGTVKRWENNKIKISKAMWNYIFNFPTNILY